jgi:hypothetical protein
MKFLCVPCDQPMKLLETRPPDRGSITLVYSCDACGYEFAMMTNPHETQIVGSLGVQVGAAEEGQAAAGESESKCPFTGIVREMTEPVETEEFPWTPRARERLASVPEFVRPMAKKGIERFAREKGFGEVNDEVLDEAKQFFGM